MKVVKARERGVAIRSVLTREIIISSIDLMFWPHIYVRHVLTESFMQLT